MKLKDLILDRLDGSVEQFCKQVNISRPVIAGIINNTYKHKIRLVTIKKICKYFKVNYRDYME